MNKMVGQRVNFYLSEKDLALWDKIPSGERSSFIKNALAFRANDQKDRAEGKSRCLKLGERENLFRLEDDKGVYWVAAKHLELMKMPNSEPLTVCPRCRCAYYGGVPELDSQHSQTRGNCPECREELLIKASESLG